MTSEVECRDLANSAAACKQALPDLGHSLPDPAYKADSGDDDSAPPGILL
jgi:hypothetical protein